MTSVELPSELVAKILKSVLADATSTQSFRRVLSACSLVCEYWCRLCRPLLFKRIQLSSSEEVSKLSSMLRGRPKGPLWALAPARLIEELVVCIHDPQSSSLPWLHHVGFLARSLPYCDDKVVLELIDETHEKTRFLQGLTLPRTLPAGFLPFTTLQLRHTRFERYSQLRKVCRSMRCVETMSWGNVRWNIDDSTPNDYGLWNGALPPIQLVPNSDPQSTLGMSALSLRKFARSPTYVSQLASICTALHEWLKSKSQSRMHWQWVTMTTGCYSSGRDHDDSAVKVMCGSGSWETLIWFIYKKDIPTEYGVVLRIDLTSNTSYDANWSLMQHLCRSISGLTRIELLADSVRSMHAFHNTHRASIMNWSAEVAMKYQIVSGNIGGPIGEKEALQEWDIHEFSSLIGTSMKPPAEAFSGKTWLGLVEQSDNREEKQRIFNETIRKGAAKLESQDST